MDEDENGVETCLMYEGSDRGVFEKVIYNKFGGDSSVGSKLSIIYYMAMFDTLAALKPFVVNGETATQVAEALAASISNLLVGVNVNLFPPEVRKSLLALTMMSLVQSVPDFMASTERSIAEHLEKESTALKN